MKSVAYVTTTFPTLAWFIENEVDRLHKRGVAVHVLALRGVGDRYQPRFAHLVPLVRSVGSPLDPRGWAALLGWLVRKPHVLIPEVVRMLAASWRSGYALAGHLGYLPAAARVADIVEREGIERVHGVWAHFPASAAYLAAKLTGRPFSMAAHAGSDLHRTRAFLAEKARAATFTACCVRGNAEMLRRLAGPRARVEWIYHGVDLEGFDGAGRRRSPEPTLLCVGRLAATKGFGDAVRALAELERMGHRPRLVFAGDGPDRAALEGLAAQLGVRDRVTFAGALTHEQLLPHYRSTWMLVAPSRVLANGRQDGIPNVVVEAMAMGVPCVGTRAAGLEEAIQPGVTGALCAPEDPAGLAAAIAGQLARPDDLDPMGERARAIVRERFDCDRNFERMWALFLETDPHAGAGAAETPARLARQG
jgi:colanic acid/amylovoran biosynthesis glycosyltransferase